MTEVLELARKHKLRMGPIYLTGGTYFVDVWGKNQKQRRCSGTSFEELKQCIEDVIQD